MKNTFWTTFWIMNLSILLTGCMPIRPEAPETWNRSLSASLEISPTDLKAAANEAQNSLLNDVALAADDPEEFKRWLNPGMDLEDNNRMLIVSLAFSDFNRPYLAEALNISESELETAVDQSVKLYAQDMVRSNSALQDEIELSLINYQLQSFISEHPLETMPSLSPVSKPADIIDTYVSSAIQEGLIPDKYSKVFEQLEPCRNDFSIVLDDDNQAFELLPGINLPSCLTIPTFPVPGDGSEPSLPNCENCYGDDVSPGQTIFTPIDMPAIGVQSTAWEYGQSHRHKWNEIIDCRGYPKLTVYANGSLSINITQRSGASWIDTINAAEAYTFCGSYIEYTVTSNAPYRVDSSVDFSQQQL